MHREQLFSIRRKTHLDMSVAKECHASLGGPEGKVCVVCRYEVFVFIRRGTMHAACVGHGWRNRPRGQALEPLHVLSRQHGARPLHGAIGDGTEVVILLWMGTGAVVIAANAETAFRLNSLDYLVGVRRIADQISEIPDRVMFRCNCQDGVESFEIGMYIGNDQSAHGEPIQFCKQSRMFAAFRALWRINLSRSPSKLKDNHGRGVFGFVFDGRQRAVCLLEGKCNHWGTQSNFSSQGEKVPGILAGHVGHAANLALAP